MLILAGVSLNAIIGDNGIITNAQTANIKSGMAALEEYLQEKYVEYYDEANNYNSKPELLASKIKNLFLQDGTNDYIVFGGEKYYLINKASLPKEVKDGLIGGNTTEWAKYIRLEDVYGVTSDLKVFYCDKSTGTEYGVLEGMAIDATQPSKKINDDIGGVKDSIAATLKTMGIDVSERDITLADIAKIKDLTLDQTTSTSTITNLSALAEMRDLQTLTLSNLTLSNLDGLEYCTNLYYIYFKNCKIEDYSKLCYNWELEYIYMYLPPSMETDDANDQVTALGNGLHDASNLKKVKYFGISGEETIFLSGYSDSTNYNVNFSKLTNLSGISNIHSNIKQSIQYLYLNNNGISSIADLSGFDGIVECILVYNKALENLIGLENHTELNRIRLKGCSKLVNLEGLEGCTGLKSISLGGCTNLQSLSGIESCETLEEITLWSMGGSSSKFEDIMAISGLASLRILCLNGVTKLVDVSPVGNLTNLISLEMDSTCYSEETVTEALVVTGLGGRIKNFSINEKYRDLFVDTYGEWDLSVDKVGLLEDGDTKFTRLANKSAAKRLNLSGQSSLTNTQLQTVLSTMTGLNALCLNGVSQLSSIDFIGEYETEDEDGNTITVDKVKNLIELDLRGTSRSLTDLSNLNNYGLSLKRLVVDNPDIDVTLIQTAINKIGENSGASDYEDSWVASNGWHLSGTVFLGQINGETASTTKKYNFNECTLLTNFTSICNCTVIGNQTYMTEIDLSNCGSMAIKLGGGDNYAIVSLPSACKSVDSAGVRVNMFYCRSIGTLSFHGFSYTKHVYSYSLSSVDSTNKPGVSTISFWRPSISNLNFLNSFNLASLTYLKLNGYDTGELTEQAYTNLSGIENCSNLEKVEVTYAKKLTDFSDFASFTGSSLTCLDFTGCSGITSLDGLETLTSLVKLYLPGCSISDVDALANLKSLRDLVIYNNYITDLEPLESCITYSNTDDTTGNIGIKSLSLHSNPIKGTAENGNDNLETLRKLHNAGLNKINIYKTNFSSTDKQTLISIFGEANVTMDKEW